MLKYKCITDIKTQVYLEGKKVGIILYVQVGNRYGYQYFPLNTKIGGEVFDTEQECKQSLEEG